MTRLYIILSIAGWIWLVGLFGYLLITSATASRRKEPRGFEVERSKGTD